MRPVDILRRYGHSTGIGPLAPSFHGTIPILLGIPTAGVAGTYLRASGITSSPTTVITQQWTLDGVDIGGATGNSYTPAVGDVGKTLRVREIATTPGFSPISATSAGVVISAASAPSVPGNKTILGINLAQPLYYERSPGPVNWFMAVANAGQGNYPNGGWELRSHADRNNYAAQDAKGWPTEDFHAVTWSGEEGTGIITLTVQFKGKAVLFFYSARGGSAMTFGSYNAGTNISRWTYSYDPSVNNVGPEIAFTSTQRDSTAAFGTGVTDIFCWESRNIGNTTDRWDGPRLTSTILAPFSYIRVMDLMETNQAREHQDWANRKVFADFPGGRMASMCNIEGITNLINVTGKDLWLQDPINASNDYIDGSSIYLNTNLTAGKKVMRSIGNETWNPTFESFTQTNINAATELRAGYGGTTDRRFGRSITAAVRSGATVTLFQDFVPDVKAGENIYIWAMPSIPSGPYKVLGVNLIDKTVSVNAGSGGDGDLGFLGAGSYYFSLDVVSTLRGPAGNVNLYEMGFWWMVRRCVQMSDRIRATLGNGVMFTRFFPHVEEQQSQNGDGFQTCMYLSYLAGGDTAVKTKVWAVAVASYFGGPDDTHASGTEDVVAEGASVAHTVQDYIDWLKNTKDFSRAFTYYAERVAHLAHFGLKAIFYEGGPFVDWEGGFQNNINKNLAKLDPQFYAIHLDYLKRMGQVGISHHTHYQSAFWDAGNNPATHTWGFTDRVTNVTPFWQSFIDYAAADPATLPTINPISSTIGTPTVIDGSMCVGRFGVSTSYPGLFRPNVFPNNNKQDYQATCGVNGTYNFKFAYACNFVPNDMKVEVNGVIVAASQFTPTVTDTFPALNGTHDSPVFSIPVLAGVNVIRIIGVVNHNGNNNEAFKSLTLTRTA